MSFSLAEATPLACARAGASLDYAALMAAIGGSRPRGAAGTDSVVEGRLRAMTPALCLVIVLLGRSEWREAAWLLGGRFAALDLSQTTSPAPESA